MSGKIQTIGWKSSLYASLSRDYVSLFERSGQGNARPGQRRTMSSGILAGRSNLVYGFLLVVAACRTSLAFDGLVQIRRKRSLPLVIRSSPIESSRFIGSDRLGGYKLQWDLENNAGTWTIPHLSEHQSSYQHVCISTASPSLIALDTMYPHRVGLFHTLIDMLS